MGNICICGEVAAELGFRLSDDELKKICDIASQVYTARGEI